MENSSRNFSDFSEFFLGSIDVDIPKEHHRFVVGKGAKVLKRIQDQTGAKISVPNADEQDGLIRVTGPQEAMDAAKVILK